MEICYLIWSLGIPFYVVIKPCHNQDEQQSTLKKSKLTSQTRCQRPCKGEISSGIHLLCICTPTDAGIMTDTFFQL